MLGFEWACSHATPATWEDRLNELASYRKIHGHCNIPRSYNENNKLGKWVAKQRSNYRLHVKGKTWPMTTFRINRLEGLGFGTAPGLPGKTVERACRLSLCLGAL
jgi:hypothetical protein